MELTDKTAAVMTRDSAEKEMEGWRVKLEEPETENRSQENRGEKR